MTCKNCLAAYSVGTILLIMTGCTATKQGPLTSAPETVSPPAVTHEQQTPPPVEKAQEKNLSAAEIKQQKTIKAIKSMAAMQENGVAHLSQLARTGDPAIRLAAVETLGKIKHSTAIDPLIQSLSDDDHTIRSKASLFMIINSAYLTPVHVDRLMYIVRHATKGWPDPAWDGATIYANHYAARVITRAESPHITPQMTSEAEEAIQQYD